MRVVATVLAILPVPAILLAYSCSSPGVGDFDAGLDLDGPADRLSYYPPDSGIPPIAPERGDAGHLACPEGGAAYMMTESNTGFDILLFDPLAGPRPTGCALFQFTGGNGPMAVDSLGRLLIDGVLYTMRDGGCDQQDGDILGAAGPSSSTTYGVVAGDAGPTEVLFELDAFDRLSRLDATGSTLIGVPRLDTGTPNGLSPTLAGGADGRLFVFYSPASEPGKRIDELNPVTSGTVGRDSLFDVSPQDVAFLRIGEQFFLFSGGFNTGTSNRVDRYDIRTKKLDQGVFTFDGLVVAASASSCASP